MVYLMLIVILLYGDKCHGPRLNIILTPLLRLSFIIIAQKDKSLLLHEALILVCDGKCFVNGYKGLLIDVITPSLS